MNASPITAAKASEIRKGFAAKADEYRGEVALLRAAGNDAMADLVQRQVDSWASMAVRRYETMTVAGTI